MLQWCYWRQVSNGPDGGWSISFLAFLRWLSWKFKITCISLSHLPRNHYKQTQLLFRRLLFICVYAIAVAWHCWGESDLLFNVWILFSVEVGIEMGWAWWPCFLLSHFVLFLNLLLGTIVSQPLYAWPPKATCLDPPRPRRNHLCCCLQCSLSGISFCWLPF